MATLRTARSVPRTGVYGFAVALGEAAGRPVRLGGVAAARAVERGDVLERDEDVPVQLDVRDAFDAAVGRQRAVLVLAAEELDVDLLSLVLTREVVHRDSVYPRDSLALDGDGGQARVGLDGVDSPVLVHVHPAAAA